MATATVKNVSIAVIVMAVVGGLVWFTWYTTDNHWSRKWLARDAADLQAQVKTAQQNAATEHDWQRKFAAIDADYQAQLQANKNETDRIIADYQRGTKRLRQSLSCAARNMPDVATAPGVSDAAAKCGLSATDVEFLVRFAGDAKDTADQLAKAQALLRTIYASQPK